MKHDREMSEPPDSERHGPEERVERALRAFQSATDVEMLARSVLAEVASVVPVVQAVLYVSDSEGTTGSRSAASGNEGLRLRLAASYATTGEVGKSFAFGEGLVGQCARERRTLSVGHVPAEHFRIQSGLGVSAPRQLTLVPVPGASQVAAVLELATFELLDPIDERFVALLAEGLSPMFQKLSPSVRREASRYKPEVFACLGHELRTPLNSLLVLSQMLAENADKNLTAKQVGFARAINASGKELLSLINEVLELAKIESSTLSIEPAEITLEQVREHLERGFRHVAAGRGVSFSVDLRGSLPAAIVTDPKRLQQVLKNLLESALKFTEKGAVSVSVSPARSGWSDEHAVLNQAESVVAFGVSHSRAGTSGERSSFAEVFSDAGEGTGQRALARIGCTVSREIARLLGGELRVGNTPDAGNTVTLYLPAVYRPPSSRSSSVFPEELAELRKPPSPASLPVFAVSGPADELATPRSSDASRVDDRIILSVLGDADLEDALRRSAVARGYRSVTTSNIMNELAAPTKALPTVVALDLRPEDLAGWVVLDRLRQDPVTRHIPVAVLVAREQGPKARRMGAAALLEQPTPSHVDAALTELELYAPGRERSVLVVHVTEAPAEKDVVTLIAAEGLRVRQARSAEEGLAALGAERLHACVWCLGTAEDVTSLGALRAGERTPIIVYTGRPLKPEAAEQLLRRSDGLTLKLAASMERLLHELSICLHRPEAAYPSAQRHVLAKVARHPPELAGLRVLLVDADVRSVFAMTSALEHHGALVSYADNVEDGLSLVESEPSIGAVLADAGLTLENDLALLRYVRRGRDLALPFIALASEPCASERERCLRAGATHYAAKPIAARHLVSVLRVAILEGAERGLVVCR